MPPECPPPPAPTPPPTAAPTPTPTFTPLYRVESTLRLTGASIPIDEPAVKNAISSAINGQNGLSNDVRRYPHPPNPNPRTPTPNS